LRVGPDERLPYLRIVYHVYTIDEDPHSSPMSFMMVAGRPRRLSLPKFCPTPPNSPFLPKLGQSLRNLGAGASPNCGTTGGRWPCDRRYGIWNPREMCMPSEIGQCHGGRPTLRRISSIG
jgi:hypothetical protein